MYTSPDPEKIFKNWIMIFHELRIQGFISDKESEKVFKRICKYISNAGYTVSKTGFYEYEITKIEK